RLPALGSSGRGLVGFRPGLVALDLGPADPTLEGFGDTQGVLANQEDLQQEDDHVGNDQVLHDRRELQAEPGEAVGVAVVPVAHVLAVFESHWYAPRKW